MGRLRSTCIELATIITLSCIYGMAEMDYLLRGYGRYVGLLLVDVGVFEGMRVLMRVRVLNGDPLSRFDGMRNDDGVDVTS